KNNMYICDETTASCFFSTRYLGNSHKKDIDIKEVIKKLGYPSVDALKRMIKCGAIDNIPLDMRDLRDLDEKKELVEIIKGRETNCRQMKYEDKVMGTTRLELYGFIDLMFIEKSTFMICVLKPSNYIIACEMYSKEKEMILEAVHQVISILSIYKHKIIKIFSDNEKAIEACRNDLLNNGILLETCSVNEHVGVVERSIRLIKERCRIVVHVLDYA